MNGVPQLQMPQVVDVSGPLYPWTAGAVVSDDYWTADRLGEPTSRVSSFNEAREWRQNWENKAKKLAKEKIKYFLFQPKGEVEIPQIKLKAVDGKTVYEAVYVKNHRVQRGQENKEKSWQDLSQMEKSRWDRDARVISEGQREQIQTGIINYIERNVE